MHVSVLYIAGDLSQVSQRSTTSKALLLQSESIGRWSKEGQQAQANTAEEADIHC